MAEEPSFRESEGTLRKSPQDRRWKSKTASRSRGFGLPFSTSQAAGSSMFELHAADRRSPEGFPISALIPTTLLQEGFAVLSPHCRGSSNYGGNSIGDLNSGVAIRRRHDRNNRSSRKESPTNTALGVMV